MANYTRKTHVAPGVYTSESEFTTSSTSVGSTTLGVAGETLKGPAFEPIEISDWAEFKSTFGGTSAEQFPDSKMPRYELPYIAKDYLTQSSSLIVTRVLGLSGYNAGPAWVIKSIGEGKGNGMILAVLRSRGKYEETSSPVQPTASKEIVPQNAITNGGEYVVKAQGAGYIMYDGIKYKDNDTFTGVTGRTTYETVNGATVHYNCGYNTDYDHLSYYVDPSVKGSFLQILPANSDEFIQYCNGPMGYNSTSLVNIPCTVDDLGTFKLKGKTIYGEDFEYTVSFNSGNRNYIYDVLGNTINDNNAPIYIEELYDVALKELVANQTKGTDFITGIFYEPGRDVKNGIEDTQKETITEGSKVENEKYGILSQSGEDRVRVDYVSDEILSGYIEDGVDYYAKGIINYDTYNTVNIEEKTTPANESRENSIIYIYDQSGHVLTLTDTTYQPNESGFNKNEKVIKLNSDIEPEIINQQEGIVESMGEDKVISYTVSEDERSIKIIEVAYKDEGGTYTKTTTTKLATGITKHTYDKTVFTGGNNVYYYNNEGDTESTVYLVHKYYEQQTFVGIEDIPIIGCGVENENGELVDGEVEVAKTTTSSNGLLVFDSKVTKPIFNSVDGVVSATSASLKKSMVGKRYLYVAELSPSIVVVEDSVVDGEETHTTVSYDSTDLASENIGKIVEVKKDVDANGKTVYRYHYNASYAKDADDKVFGEKLYYDGFTLEGNYSFTVYVENEGVFYKNYGTVDGMTNVNVQRVFGDLNDYKESFRSAVTPWIVSEMKGTSEKNEVIKLFRVHTISDGNYSNNLVKIGITNIDIDNLTFTLQVRSFEDSDANPVILEQYSMVNLNPNSSRYLPLLVGDVEDSYPRQSNYITIEMSDNENARYSVPEGFLGYPTRKFNEQTNEDAIDYIASPRIAYNVTYDSEVKDRKQYFGFSDIVGIDTDILSYKGVTTYTDGTYTDSFHLDSRVGEGTTVDGVADVFTWQTVSVSNLLENGNVPPQLSSEEDAEGSIYEKKALRKFVVLTYGGFDGWDIYRGSRTTGDDFKYSNYKGDIDTEIGIGGNFSVIKDYSSLNLTTKGITSDYYAFLAGARSFANPKSIDINIFATPGIDYVNDRLLVDEVIDMIEEDRGDALYVVTTPDKEKGTSDSKYSMYSALDASDNLDVAEINSSYTCTFFPWGRYYDEDNSKFIYLPVTRDVVKNIAMIDTKSYPWYPPAGTTNGLVSCVNLRSQMTLEDEDTLYANRINPIETLTKSGMYINGQKTLQLSTTEEFDSPLTRIGVRRLMLKLKKDIKRACVNMLFTPNDEATRATFIGLVTPIIEGYKSTRGISEYKLKVSYSQEDYEQRQISAKLWIKPTDVLEYINLDFVVTSQNVDFNEL